MTNFALALLLSTSLNTPVPEKTSTDSIPHKEIKEITVYSLATGQLSLPYVSVEKKMLETQAFATPADALATQTGISVSKDGVWATSVNVRGMSEQRLLFLSDEDRMQSATDIAGVLSTIDLNSLQKIEVIKGAGSVLYGTGAMGGVVNFVSERPGYSDARQVTAKLSSGYYGVNKLWSNALNVNYSDKNWYLALNGSYRTAGNTQTPNAVLLNSQFNDASWGLRGGMKYGENQELLVSYNHFEAWDAGIPGGNSFPKTATVRYAGIKRNQMNAEYVFSNISRTLKELRFKAYTQNIGRNVELKPNATAVTLPSSYNVTSGAKVTAKLYFNDYNTMTVGAESWLRNAETTRTKISFGADTVFVGETPTPKANMLDVGAFALYKKIIDPHYLSMNAGLRLDYVRTENDSAFNRVFNYKIMDGQRVTIPFAKSLIFDPGVSHNISYSAHVDLEYVPVKRQKLVLSLANAYRVASIEERFKYIDLGNGVRLGDPGLKPEKGFFSNLTYSLTQNKFLVKVDFFANYLFDLIAEIKTSSAPLVYENQNIDQAFFAGAEAEIDWLINRHFRVNTNASYVYTRDISTKKPLPMIPPAHGLLCFTYRTDKYLEAAATVKWAATQNEIADAETATAGYAILNLDAHSVPVKVKGVYAQLFAGVENVLDKAYKNHLFNNRGFDFYEPGRNVFAKLKLSW